MKLCDVLPRNEILSLENSEGIEFAGVSSRTDDNLHGKLFVCIEGTRVDSHNLISYAAARGAVAALIEHDAYVPEGFPTVKVKSTRRALALASYALYAEKISKIRLIGVCGTNGKTSVTHFLKHIIEGAGYRCGTVGTLGVTLTGAHFENAMWSMTTPDPEVLYPTLARMHEMGAEYVILEASSHALALSKLDALKFDVAIFTGITPEHLDFHKTMEEYFAAKQKLFRMSRDAVISGECPYAARIRESVRGRCITVGRKNGCDLVASDVVCNAAGTEYTLKEKGRVALAALGDYTVTNSMLAIGAGELLGIAFERCADALHGVKGPAGRLERLDLGNTDVAVLIDYAHTEAAMESTLSFLRRICSGKLTVVFGCGGERDRSKRAPMGRAAAKYADRVIVTSDNARNEEKKSIIEDILAGIPRDACCKVVCDRRRAIEYAIKSAEVGETIVLVGKGHEKYEIDNQGKHAFSEEEIVRAFTDEHTKRKKNEN